MILRGLQTKNVKLAADNFGISRQNYYFWLKRLREANYDLRALVNQSRAPKSNSRSISKVNLGIVDNNGNQVKAYPVVDDCSRVATVHVADEHSNYEAANGFKKFVEKFGKPNDSQTDNGSEFTNKYLSEENPKRKKEAVRSGYEQYLDSNGIKHKLIRPRTPQLNGKVKRFNQTLKRCVRGRLKDGMSIQAIQRVMDEFLRIGTIRLDLILL